MIVLLFSGGKDSRLLLEGFAPLLDQITVVWVNPGDYLSDDEAYVRGLLSQCPHHTIIESDVKSHIKTCGWPVDVVPVNWTVAGQIGHGKRPFTFQPYTECCFHNIWKPLNDWIVANNVTKVYTGQRNDEEFHDHRREIQSVMHNGVEWVSPLAHWTEAQVWAALHRLQRVKGLQVAPSYLRGATASVTCAHCTAYRPKARGRVLPQQIQSEVDAALLALQLAIKESL